MQLKRAEAGELTARQNQYASDMNFAKQAVDDGDLFQASQLLERNRPSFGVPASAGLGFERSLARPDRLKVGLQTDLRGWEWRYLWKQCQGEQLFILGYHTNGVSPSRWIHAEGVTAAGFLPDGKTAYSAGEDKAVRLWDVATRRQIGLLPHDQPVTGAACSPDGRWLASGTQGGGPQTEGPLRLWNLATREAAVLTTKFWLRPTLVFSPDSKLLAFVDVYSGIHLWSLAPPREEANLPAYFHYTGSLGVAFSPDGQTLTYNENEAGDIVLWDVHSRSVKTRLKGHRWYVRSLAFTPDGQLLASGSADRTVKLWDMATHRERVTFTNYAAGVVLRMSPDGKMLSTAASIGKQRITLQQIPTGTEIRRLRGHQNAIADLGFSPDGRLLITGSKDGTVRVWDIATLPKDSDSQRLQLDLDEFIGSAPALCLSPDGRHLLTVFTNNTFSVWEMPTLTEGQHRPLPVEKFACAALATGGKVAAFVAVDGNVVFWHGDTDQTNWFARPTTNGANRAVFSFDGKRFALDGKPQVCVCDVASKTKIRTFFIGEGEDATSLTFSRDGQKLMGGFDDGVVKAWQLSGATNEVKLEGHEGNPGMTLSADGRTLLSVSADIRLWDLKNPGTHTVLDPRPAYYHSCALSPDGRRLAVGAFDGLITIWDPASRQQVATLKGHERPVEALSFLSDDNTLVSVGVDQLRVCCSAPTVSWTRTSRR